ncbi:MAG: protein-L-isoaspartate(D-aspartate) O-methyltransferase [Anaerolineae bacterium]|nr:protein-L-isoaspartate(D-aspartate) O-methyltransferase [Anaerolineae bacterium]
MNILKDSGARERQRMVKEQIEARGIYNERLLEVMRRVPRHLFVPDNYRSEAYQDYPLPIACNQTISQPYMVAYMTQLLHLNGNETVLEVGTGSGYQAAILAEMCHKVISLERYGELADSASNLLGRLKYKNIEVHQADGSQGWPEGAPYQGILVTAAAPAVPLPLLQQMADGGRLVIPVGPRSAQELQLWERQGRDYHHQVMLPVVFVPLRGMLGWNEDTPTAR